MRGWLGLLLVPLLAACAASDTRIAPAAAPSGAVEVTVTREGDHFSALYRFPREAAGWSFERSANIYEHPTRWRPLNWVIVTPGLTWADRNGRDTLVAPNGTVPREVRILFRPAPITLAADYQPALTFGDGSVALFTDHFLPVPAGAGNPGEEPELPVRLTFRDSAGPVLHRGRRYDSATFDGEGMAYVLFGRSEPLQTEYLSAVIDEGLPRWYRDELLAFAPSALAHYAARLGPPPTAGKPMVMVRWAGSERGGFSQSGSALPGLIVMSVSGERLLQRNAEVERSARWFIGHEAAHFWLGQAISYSDRSEAWITEGGADLLANRMLQALDPDYDASAALKRNWDECVRLAAGKAVRDAARRQEHRAYYGCGAMFAMVAEAAARRRGGDAYTFVRGLIEGNREDRKVSADEWLAALTELSGDPSLAADIGRMVNDGVADPDAALRSLFARAGAQVPA